MIIRETVRELRLTEIVRTYINTGDDGDYQDTEELEQLGQLRLPDLKIINITKEK